MDPEFATISAQQPTPEIPLEIYEPLLSIALHGYSVGEVNLWYQSMLRHVRWRNIDTSQAPSAGFDLATTASIDPPCPGFLDRQAAARRATVATIDSCMSPMNQLTAVQSTETPAMNGDVNQAAPVYNVAQDNMSQAYNTPQSYQTYAATPQQLDTTPDPPQGQTFMPTWSPAPSSAAEPDGYALAHSASLSTGNLMAFAAETSNNAPAYSWFNTQDAGSLHTRTHSQQSQLSQHSLSAPAQQMGQLPHQQRQQQQQQHHHHHHPHQTFLSPEYNTQLSGTAMPVLVPYASSSGSSNYTKAAAIPTGPGASLYSSSAGYFPIIHVSSSRRRRKALQKGVKKMVQPLKGRRQQSV